MQAKTKIVVALVAFGLTILSVSLGNSYKVSAFQDVPSDFYFLCDGTSMISKDNPNRVECSVGLVGPFSDSTGAQNTRLDAVCNGPSDAFGNPPTPNIDHPAGSNYAQVKDCANGATLVSVSYINTKTNAPITQTPTDTTVIPGSIAPVQVVGPSGIDVGDLPQPATDTASLIQTGLKIIFGILGAVSLLIITLAGFKYVVSRGDPQGISKAKNTIIYAVIGLIIAVSAEIIVGFVVGKISP